MASDKAKRALDGLRDKVGGGALAKAALVQESRAYRLALREAVREANDAVFDLEDVEDAADRASGVVNIQQSVERLREELLKLDKQVSKVIQYAEILETKIPDIAGMLGL